MFVPMFESCYGDSAQFLVEIPLTKNGDPQKTENRPSNGDNQTTTPGSEDDSSERTLGPVHDEPTLVPLSSVYQSGRVDSCPGVPVLIWSKPSSLHFLRDPYWGEGVLELLRRRADAAKGATTGGGGGAAAAAEGLPPAAGAGGAGGSPPSQRNVVPYLLQAVLTYLNSLLNLQILPHRILQCFLFDLCVYYECFSLLQQLLHYHIFSDNSDLCRRLVSLLLAHKRREGREG